MPNRFQIACLGAGLLAAGLLAAPQNPRARFVAEGGRGDWTSVACWRQASPDAAFGRLPKAGDVVAVDVDVRIPSGCVAQGRPVVGSRYGAGRTGVLTLEAGAALSDQYASLWVGDAPGATGVLHFAGGSLPAWASANNVTNFSYLHVGVQGVGVVTNAGGAINLREGFFLGKEPGSYGRYVHDGGTFRFCYGAKPFAVGMLGRGELEVRSGTLALRDLLVGGTDAETSVATIREGALVTADANVSIGGYTNRMNASQLAYPAGRGRLVLAGGELRLSATGTAKAPTFHLGRYAAGYGEIAGWGTVSVASASQYLVFGRGRVVADGEGEPRALDLSALAGCVDLHGDRACGWFARNAGAVLLPAVPVALDAAGRGTGVFGGVVSGGEVPALVNAVRCALEGAPNAAVRLRGGVYAADHPDLRPETFPANHRGVLAGWRLKAVDAADAPLDFVRASLTFRYDASALPADAELALHRFENGRWRQVAACAPNAEGTIVVDGLPPASGDEANVGTFLLVATGRRLTFRPQAYDTLNGRAYWLFNSAANWLLRDGVTSVRPAEGDSLVVTNATGSFLAANLATYVNGLRFTSTAGNDHVSHSGFYLQEGGEGLVSEVPSGSRTVYASLYLAGEVGLNVTSSFVFTGIARGRGADRRGRFVKDGPGTLVLAGAGAHFDGATVREGVCRLPSVSTPGVGFHFDGASTNAWLELAGDLVLTNGALTSARDMPSVNHGLTDAGRGCTFAVVGTPREADAVFAGSLCGSTGFRFAPSAAGCACTFIRAVSSTAGPLSVSNGTVRVTEGAAFTNLASVVLEDAAARFVVDGGARVVARRLALPSGARVAVSADARLEVPAGGLVVDGVAQPAGVYSARGGCGAVAAPWIEGEGCVRVGGAEPKRAADAYRDAGGDYVFGNPDWRYTTATGDWSAQMDAPPFASLYFPPDARLRFRGGLRFDSFPEGAASLDWSGLSGLAVTQASPAGTNAFAVGSAVHFWFQPRVDVPLDATGAVARELAAKDDAAARTLSGDVALDGVWHVNDSTGPVRHAGRLSGSGRVELVNFYSAFAQRGCLDWTGTFQMGGNQCGTEVVLSPTNALARTGGVRQLGGSDAWTTYGCLRFVWAPQDPAGGLRVDDYSAPGPGGFDAAHGTRYGNALCVVPPARVDIGALATGAGGLHVAGARSESATPPGTGLAEVSVQELAAGSRLWMSTNVHVTVGTAGAGCIFDYTAVRTGYTPASLQVGEGARGATLRVYTPQQLPRGTGADFGRIEVVGTNWTVVVATNAAVHLPAALAMPPTGTVSLVLSGPLPPPGLHPVFTWDARHPLAEEGAWPVAPRTGRAALGRVVRTDRGLFFEVPEGTTNVVYYVDSEAGDDAADGISPRTAWRTLARVNAADVLPGERVLFRRGGLWRGTLRPHSGAEGAPVYYGAYGTGAKPILQNSAAADGEGDWVQASRDVWRWTGSSSGDVGNLIFDHGATNGWKRWSLDTLAREYDYWYERGTGRVYLRLAENPARRHRSVELSLRGHVVDEGSRHHVVYEGLWIRYGGIHGFGGGSTHHLVIRNCDVSWIGGAVQKWEDDGKGGEKPVRYGNGIEFWDASHDNLVEGNRLWQIYDAALTNQGREGQQRNLTWRYNVVWDSEYSYEYFGPTNDAPTVDVVVEHNTFVDAGGGWAHQQRPDANGANLMLWHDGSNHATTNFVVRNNIFAGSTEQSFRMTTDWTGRIALSNNLHWVEGGACVFRNPAGGAQYWDWDGYLAFGCETNALFARPLFWNAARRDYRLRRNSPGVGLASDAPAVGAFPVPVWTSSAVLVR